MKGRNFQKLRIDIIWQLNINNLDFTIYIFPHPKKRVRDEILGFCHITIPTKVTTPTSDFSEKFPVSMVLLIFYQSLMSSFLVYPSKKLFFLPLLDYMLMETINLSVS